MSKKSRDYQDEQFERTLASSRLFTLFSSQARLPCLPEMAHIQMIASQTPENYRQITGSERMSRGNIIMTGYLRVSYRMFFLGIV